ncbi:MAG TPA: hypothetical protein VGQ83_12275 [Polyangia bacterium]|jgi:hypothetical protein
MIKGARSFGRLARVMVLVAALLAPSVSPAQSMDPTVDHGTSNIQYVVRATFFLSLAMLAFILVQAARSPSQDTARLKASMDSLDRGLARARGQQPARSAAHDTRLERAAHRGLRLFAD